MLALFQKIMGPPENFDLLSSNAKEIKFQMLTHKEDMAFPEFVEWFQKVRRLVRNHSYSSLVLPKNHFMRTIENRSVIGLANLYVLGLDLQPDEVGYVGIIKLSQNMRTIFNQLDTSHESNRNINGMLYSVEESVASCYINIFKERGAIQLGTEDWSDILLFQRRRSALCVKNRSLTFVCHNASEDYTAQWVAAQNDLSTFSWFTKRTLFLTRHSVIITVCDFDDAKLIGGWFLILHNSSQLREPEHATSKKLSVLFYLSLKSKKLDVQLCRAAEKLKHSHPNFRFFIKLGRTDFTDPKEALALIWKAEYPRNTNNVPTQNIPKIKRAVMEEPFHFVVASYGYVRPVDDTSAVSVTTPIDLKSETETKPDIYHIEILAKLCHYDIFKFSEEVIEYIKSFEPTETLEDNHKLLLLNGSLKAIASKYQSIKSKSNGWFSKVANFVSETPYHVVIKEQVTVNLDNHEPHSLTIAPHTIGLVCLHKFKLAATEISRRITGTVGIVHFDQSASRIFLKLQETIATDPKKKVGKLCGMFFIAQQELMVTIKNSLVSHGAIQLVTEVSSEKQTYEDEHRALIRKRKELGSAYFVAKRGVRFAVNVSDDYYTEQFVATQLDLCTFTWFDKPGRGSRTLGQSFTITASMILDLKTIIECFLVGERKTPKEIDGLVVLYYLGDESKTLDMMLVRSALNLKNDFDCIVEISNHNQDKYETIQEAMDAVAAKEYIETDKMRSKASLPYSKNDRDKMDDKYHFIIAPPEWAKPSDSAEFTMSITMPVKIKVEGDWEKYDVEIICQSRQYDPFAFVELFTTLMGIKQTNVPHEKTLKTGFEELSNNSDAKLSVDEKNQ